MSRSTNHLVRAFRRTPLSAVEAMSPVGVAIEEVVRAGLLGQQFYFLAALVGALAGGVVLWLLRFAWSLFRSPVDTEREARKDIERLYSERVERHEADRARLGELEAHADPAQAPIVVVKTFQHDLGSASLYVTNISGRADEFAAQVIGLAKHGSMPTESRMAWHLRWHGEEAPKIRLHPGEKGRIDFAWIEHKELHEVVETERSRLVGNRSVNLYLNSCPLLHPTEEVLAGKWYGELDEVQSMAWNILVSFTAGGARRAQVECFTVRVVGECHEGDDHRVIVNTAYGRPTLWIGATLTPPSGETTSSEPQSGSGTV